VRVVHGGHDPSFGRERLIELIDAYLARATPARRGRRPVTGAPDAVTLRRGAARLAVSPHLGGVILGYWSSVTASGSTADAARLDADRRVRGLRHRQLPARAVFERIRNGASPFVGGQ